MTDEHAHDHGTDEDVQPPRDDIPNPDADFDEEPISDEGGEAGA